jgi:hypothetical protein
LDAEGRLLGADQGNDKDGVRLPRSSFVSLAE